jgi:TP901 family phage tail tape measure protein
MQHLGSNISSFNTVLGGAGAGMAVRTFVKAGMDFQLAMNKISAVSKKFTDEDIARLEKRAKELGASTEYSAVQIAMAMLEMAKGAMKTEEILKAIHPIIKFGLVAGLDDLAMAAEVATSVMAQFYGPRSVEKLPHIFNVLAVAASNSKATVLEINSSLLRVGNTAEMVGLSLEETTAMIMSLAQVGIKGEEAGTFLNNALKELITLSPKARKIFRQLKIDPKGLVDAKGQIKDLTGLVKKLDEAGATASQLTEVFLIRGC